MTGRPTKYNQDMLEAARAYLANYKEHDHVIPSIAGLATVLHVSRGTLYIWGKEYAEFLNILDDIQSTQESVLVNNGLRGDFNSAITKLVLGKHGYHEKQEMDHRSGDGSMSPTRIEITAPDDDGKD